MSSKKQKRIVKGPIPSLNTNTEDSTEDFTEDTESSSTSDENLSGNNNLATEKKIEKRKHTFMKKDKNVTGFLFQKTISSPLQNQLEHTTSVQSSLQQIPVVPTIEFIESVHKVIKSPARLVLRPNPRI